MLDNGVADSTVNLHLGDWQCCATSPGSVAHPHQLDEGPREWLSAAVPGTVAGVLKANGRWNLNQPLHADDQDWWFRTQFSHPELPAEQPCFLCFDGLATLAEVWLNGQRVLTTDNMFRPYRVDVHAQLRAANELAIAFRSLNEDLKLRRPRPRWKTNLVNHQQLRWRRTTLLGRIPGWSPAVPPVGPWRPVRLEAGPVSVTNLRLLSTVEGMAGKVRLTARIRSLQRIERAILTVGRRAVQAQVLPDHDECSIQAELVVPDPPLWWPHTHGEQPLVECSLHVEVGGTHHVIECGKIAFRQLSVTQVDNFAIAVNEVPVYCRGACWTVCDIVTLAGNEETLRHDLCLARNAGINMLRVGGTMIYETDRFYDLCDELGILVWQDFMFANMDYPVDDPEFAANIEAEAEGVLGRLSRHPCVAVYCGNSEVEQQAAMLGMPRELWRNDWFAQRLPALCNQHHPGAAYVPSTPSGGVMPFHVRSGVTHYYGVGAYRRAPDEVRRDDVKFSPECLGFANIPVPETIEAAMEGRVPAMHHPRWKERVPRDTGAGWDFEDVRDHYLREFFGVDPVQTRWSDTARYLQLSRLVSGEMMAQVFGEWRSGHSRNRGALVWFFKDLWPGAGWGIVDSLGLPKPAYYYLRRSWKTRQVTITDEGLDGLHLHAINESAETSCGFIEVLLLKDHHVVIARGEVPCSLPPRGQRTVSADELLEGFYDVNYAYRFGPAQHDVVIATLYDARRHVVSDAYHFVQARTPTLLPAVDLTVQARRIDGQRCELSLRADRFLHGVSLAVKGYLPDDNYFHLPPEREKIIGLESIGNRETRLKGHVEALNMSGAVRISLTESDE